MEEQIIKNVTEKANSYEVGKAGNRFKLYFSDTENLKQQLKELVEAGLLIAEDFKKSG